MERKYGGRLRAHTAATKIQRAYRHYRLYLQWRHVLGGHNQASNSSRCRVVPEVQNENKFTPKNFNRTTHFRKLAQSQPSLKYFYFYLLLILIMIFLDISLLLR